METGEELSTIPWQIKAEYQKSIASFIDQYSRECRQSLIDYVVMDTSQTYDLALFAYLAKRGRLF